MQEAVAIIGGCGRVGLPLGLALADSGLMTYLVDTNIAAVDQVNGGSMPFAEEGAEEILGRCLGRRVVATTDPSVMSTCEYIVVVIGTPVDDHLNPDTEAVPDAIRQDAAHLRNGQCLILRSTLYPGVTARVERVLTELGLEIDVAFCPERIAEGKALTELHALPQIVAARTERAFRRAESLFGRLTTRTLRLSPEEAELAKLFTNTWRYIRFAIANQLFMIANDHGLDFERIRWAMREDYPRAADLPSAGFAAGPCLLKDTMQLAAFNNNGFTLGHSAMMVNEGLPLYVVSRMESRFPDLREMTVGILGVAFKGGSDDIRASLAYKLRRILRFKAREVLCSDPYVSVDPTLLPLDEVLDRADVLVIGAPHPAYESLKAQVPVIDVWNITGRGALI